MTGDALRADLIQLTRREREFFDLLSGAGWVEAFWLEDQLSVTTTSIRNMLNRTRRKLDGTPWRLEARHRAVRLVQENRP